MRLPRIGKAHVPRRRIIEYELPEWHEPYRDYARFKVAYGGRASSKTWTFAHLLVLRAVNEPIRVACCRQFGSSLDISAKRAIEVAIHRLGLSSRFKVYNRTIRGANGSFFFFRGLERNPGEIRGWEDVDIVWVEEAQYLKEMVARVLVDTIRKHRSELWFSFNPENRTDWVYQRFVEFRRPGDLVRLVNWRDNPWFPDEAEQERVADLDTNPDLYNYIWEGAPNDGAGDTRVLPYKLLLACVKAYRLGLHKKATALRGYGGLDIADGGNNQNALCIRKGPVIEYVDRWYAQAQGFLLPTAQRADRAVRERQVTTLNFDASGVGSPIRADFERLNAAARAGGAANTNYRLEPVIFGGAVKGPDRRYSYGISNEMRFAKRNAQLGFALRLRALRTVRLLRGKDVNPDTCLFISDKIPRLSHYLAELSQPLWRDNPVTGKTEIDKRGMTVNGKDMPSPDMYDATAAAFAQDSASGLRARV